MLKRSYLKYKKRDLKSYVLGCIAYQQMNNYLGKKVADHSSLEVPEESRRSKATGFAVRLPKTKTGIDCIIIYADTLPLRAHYILTREFDSSVDVD